jgi:ketosteroid isomerase-like protein
MSQENIEVIRKAYEGTNSRDFSFIERLFDKDVEMFFPPEFPGTQEARGPQGFMRALAELEEAAQEIRYELEELLDVEDRVLAKVRFVGRGRHTGISLDRRVYWLYTLRAGKITKMVVYLERAEALEAAGLSEQDAHDPAR